MSSGRAETNPSYVSTTKEVMDLLSESKEEVLYFTDLYTAIQLDPMANQFEKILFLDVDETLIDYELSLKSQKLVFIHEEKLRQVIKHAIEKNILIVLLTSRPYNEIEREGHFLSIKNVAKELGYNNFSWIFYTAGKCKSSVLDYFWMYHFDLDADKKTRLCIVDDNLAYAGPCQSKNYPVIIADKKDESARYLDLINEFLDQKIQLPQQEIPDLEEVVFLMAPIPEDEVKEIYASLKQ